MDSSSPNWTDTLANIFGSASDAFQSYEAANAQPYGVGVPGLSPYGVPYGAYGPGIVPQQGASGTTLLLLLVVVGAIFAFAFGRSR